MGNKKKRAHEKAMKERRDTNEQAKSAVQKDIADAKLELKKEIP